MVLVTERLETRGHRLTELQGSSAALAALRVRARDFHAPAEGVAIAVPDGGDDLGVGRGHAPNWSPSSTRPSPIVAQASLRPP